MRTSEAAAEGRTMPRVRARTRTVASGTILLALYGGIVTWLSWPLAAYLASRLPAVFTPLNCDRHFSAWALAWASRALITHPTRIADANIYHPAPTALFYGQTGFGALPYFAPVFLLTGNPVLALNVTLLGGLTVTAWLFHVVVRRWTGSDLAAFVAAVTFLSNRFILGFVPTAPFRAALQFFPLIAYVASQPHERLAGALVLVPLVVLQCLTDAVYIAPAVLGPLALLAAIRLVRRSTRNAGLRLAAALALAGTVLAPVYLEYAKVIAHNPDLRAQTVWKNPLAPPQPLGKLVGQQGPNALAPVTILLVAAGAALALRSGRQRAGAPPGRAWAAGALWFVIGGLMSVGAGVIVGSHVVPTPMYYLARLLPLFAIIRIPIRAGYAALTGTAILSGLAFAVVSERIRWRGRMHALGTPARLVLVALIAAGLYCDGGASNTPPHGWNVYKPPVPPPTLVQALLEAPGPLVEVPLGPHAQALWPGVHARAMFHSIYHRQPILNGYTSYYPADFPRRMAMVEKIPDLETLAKLREETGLRYVWVHIDRVQDPQLFLWRAYTGGGADILRPVARDGSDWLFELNF